MSQSPALQTPTPVPAISPRASIARIPWQILAACCAAVAVLLIAWVYFFPYTGDGDSILHYCNALVAWHKPSEALNAWSRPLYKVPLMFFALQGVFACRMFNLAITLGCLWQTVRLAEDLGLRRPLLALPMMLFQTCVFALAADTMTEIPMALGIVIATRLWLARQMRWSGLVIGLLPLIRPEGFFLGVLWGIMVVFSAGITRGWQRKGLTLVLMTTGLALWSLACFCVTLDHDWLYFIRAWSWPAVTYEAYPRGPWWYYPARWPEYCGLPLLILFIAGVVTLARGRGVWSRYRMALPVVLWLLISFLHAVLFTGGWFCSSGVLRILACSAPMTAMICLLGYNALADRLQPRLTGAAGRTVALTTVTLIALWGIGQYFLYGEHLDCFPIKRTANYLRDQHLLTPTTPFAAGNQLFVADLGLRQDDKQVIILGFGDKFWPTIHDMPLGTILIWDNRQSTAWFRVTIEALQGAGFTQLHEEQFYWPTLPILGGGTYRYVILRKDTPTPNP